MKRKLVGIVTSDKMNKSLRVEIERRFAHPMYGKIVRGRTVCHVHDEENTAHTGDTVEIIECRPRSKTKRWDLVRVLKSPVLAGAELKPQDDTLDTEDNLDTTTAETITAETTTEEAAVSTDEQ